MSDINDNRTQRFLNSKMVPPGQLGDGGEGIMSQVEFDQFLKEATNVETDNSVDVGRGFTHLNHIY